MNALATDKQVSFIASLASQRGMEVSTEGMTKAQASREIERLLALPKMPSQSPANAPQSADVVPGMYRVGDTIYKVQKSAEGRFYAKRVIGQAGEKARFEYAPGAMRFITADHRMSLEDAKAFGANYGSCCVCGRLLTAGKSVEAGIGPVCGSRI